MKSTGGKRLETSDEKCKLTIIAINKADIRFNSPMLVGVPALARPTITGQEGSKKSEEWRFEVISFEAKNNVKEIN